MNQLRRSRFLVMVIASVIVLVAQPATATPASAQDGQGGMIRPVELTLGVPFVASEEIRSDWIQPTDKLIPSVNNPPIPPDPAKVASQENTPNRDRGWNLMMYESFENVFPTGLWTARDNNASIGGEVYWDDDSYKPYGTSSWSAWAANGGADGLEPELYYYPDNIDSWMVYGPFDLSGCAAGQFDFMYWNQSEQGDLFSWVASPNGINYYGLGLDGDSGGWQFVTYDLAPYLGDTSVWLAFTFSSDSSGVDDGAFVDDVRLWCSTNTNKKPWTFMVYMDGDNDLESAAIHDFLEMSSVTGLGTDIQVVVQMDRIPGNDSSYGDWTDTRRFVLTSGMTPTQANSVTGIGEANMGQVETLLHFARWGKAVAPADHYILVLWDHGSGWRASEAGAGIKSIGHDMSNGGDGIDMPELRSTLSTLTSGGTHPIDIVGFDACLMGMIEVDNQIKGYAGIRIGSEEDEPTDGWPYDTILTLMVTYPYSTPNEAAVNIVLYYWNSYGGNYTMSAVNLDAPYSTLNNAVNDLANELIHYGADVIPLVQAARNHTTQFAYSSYVDLWDFADWVRVYISEPHIYNAAVAVKTALTNAVIMEKHGSAWPYVYGISIYFPKTAGEYDGRYDGTSNFLQFTFRTQWDEWVRTYNNYPNYPGTFAKTSPGNTASNQPQKPTLTWGASSGTTSYAVCLDTVNDNICNTSWINANTNTSKVVSLNPATTYYWQAWATNSYGSVAANEGTWWQLTTSNAPVPFAPSGTLSGVSKPTFTWGTYPTATSYYLAIWSALSGIYVFQTSVAPSCTASQCSYPLPISLANGDYKFKVLAKTPSGNTPYSSFKNFSITNVLTPATPVPIAPNGTVSTHRPTFQWYQVPHATSYRLAVYSNATASYVILLDVTPTCASNVCSYTHPSFDLVNGGYKFKVLAKNPNGASAYSLFKSFTVSSNLPLAPTLIAPSGTTSTNKPQFKWNAINGATKYHLAVYRIATSSYIINLDVLPTACTSTVCTYIPATALVSGSYKFKMTTTNTYGTSGYSGWMSFTVP